ncbi:hypothetical protein BB560_000794, partial [Smittium megazygosporum]
MTTIDKNSSNFHDFSYYTTDGLDKKVSISIIELEGKLFCEQTSKGRMILDSLISEGLLDTNHILLTDPDPEIYVTVQIWTDSQPLTLPIQSSYRPFVNSTRVWNEIVEFPIKYKDLSFNSILAFTVWKYDKDSNLSIVGGNCFPFFSKKNKFKEGKRRIKLNKGAPADPFTFDYASFSKNRTRLDSIEK